MKKGHIIIIFVFISFTIIAVHNFFIHKNSLDIRMLFDDFGGAIIEAIIIGILFYFLSFIDSKEMDNKIEAIRNIVKEREYYLNTEFKDNQFKDFFKKNSPYIITFPDLKDAENSPDISYEIEPIKDKNGAPLILNDDKEYFLIKIHARFGKINTNSNNKEKVSVGEYYFCFFYDDWYMAKNIGENKLRFHLSTQFIKPPSLSANSFVNEKINFLDGYEKISECAIRSK